MAFDPNKSQNPKLRYQDRGISTSDFSTNSGTESHYFFSPQEHDENKGFYGKDFGISNASFASRDYADLSDRLVLVERNRNLSGSRDRKSRNSGIHFGSLSYEDHSKHQRIRPEEDLEGIECQCDLGSVFKSDSNSNHSKVLTSRGAESCYEPSRIASEEKFSSVKNSNSKMGVRYPCRVASEGNLNELEYGFEFGSGLKRRSVSPNVRTPLTSEMVSDVRKTKRCGCLGELGLNCKETQSYQSPIRGLCFSPNDNPSSNKSKPSYKEKMNTLSPMPQCLCYKPKSQVRDAYSPCNLPEEFIGESLSNKPEKKVNFGSTKGNSGISKMCKFAFFWVAVVIVILSLPIKEAPFLRPDFLARNSSLRMNQTDLFLNPVDSGSNHGEDVNLERVIEPLMEEESSSRGELKKNIKSLATNGAVLIEEEEEESSSRVELEKNIKSLASNETILEEELGKLEEPDFREIPAEGNTGREEFQSELQDEFESENVKQCEVQDFTLHGLEGPAPVPDKKIGHVALVPAYTNNILDDRKEELKIKFCVAFISMAVCASLVSCIIRRKQFGEMLERYSSSYKREKSSNRRPRGNSAVLLEGSYGSIVTYEKIPVKKRGREKDGLLTPVRRSSRIRNYLASPS